MPYCATCGANNPGSPKFCQKCGRQLSRGQRNPKRGLRPAPKHIAWIVGIVILVALITTLLIYRAATGATTPSGTTSDQSIHDIGTKTDTLFAGPPGVYYTPPYIWPGSGDGSGAYWKRIPNVDNPTAEIVVMRHHNPDGNIAYILDWERKTDQTWGVKGQTAYIHTTTIRGHEVTIIQRDEQRVYLFAVSNFVFVVAGTQMQEGQLTSATDKLIAAFAT